MQQQRRSFTVCGLVFHPLFQQCTEAAAYLQQEHSAEYYVEVFREVPRDFYARRQRMVAERQLDSDAVEVFVLQGDGAAMSGEAFLQHVQEQTHFRVLKVPAASADSYENTALASWKKFLQQRGNSYCWMDVTIGEVARGRITFELYAQVVPRTCNNFWHLCKGDLGTVVPVHQRSSITSDGQQQQQQEEDEKAVELSYRGATFFRILHGAWVMGGDVSAGHSGKGGYSCYGRYFPNESHAVPHDAPGVLGMCNDGEDTNASSFYITMKPMSWMDGRYVAFGRVMDGMEVVEAIHAVDVKHNQSPRETITISDCGVIDLTD
ncbi:35 kDa cyclophilin [Trypanosoma grayi]|uniref:35 kDa cyclophilin n=1 Tax=Trypanosoma grayi TaxID=71804 RepID=UPI0004F435A0|nr:35 kDa cyclophilin [Trypanosoma grayi]KEG06610.1 35 kDa cyclophilin [Trypanosoma grayi]